MDLSEYQNFEAPFCILKFSTKDTAVKIERPEKQSFLLSLHFCNKRLSMYDFSVPLSNFAMVVPSGSEFGVKWTITYY